MRMRDLILGLIGFMALMLWVMFWGRCLLCAIAGGICKLGTGTSYETIYLVRRHRLAPDRYQRCAPQGASLCEGVRSAFATSEVDIANARKQELEFGRHMAHKVAPFKYTIGRVKIENMPQCGQTKPAEKFERYTKVCRA